MGKFAFTVTQCSPLSNERRFVTCAPQLRFDLLLQLLLVPFLDCLPRRLRCPTRGCPPWPNPFPPQTRGHRLCPHMLPHRHTIKRSWILQTMFTITRSTPRWPLTPPAISSSIPSDVV